MEGHSKQCVLHLVDAKHNHGKVVAFTEETLKKCYGVLCHRQKTKSKYSVIELPNIIDETVGYHVECYRKFTAVSITPSTKPSEQASEVHVIEGDITNAAPSTSSDSQDRRPLRSTAPDLKDKPGTNVFEKKCIFCLKYARKHHGRKLKLVKVETQNLEQNVRKFAIDLNDEALLDRIRGVDFIAKEVTYHSQCRIDYQKRAEVPNRTKGKASPWHKIRESHEKAFGIICKFIQESIIEDENVYTTKELYNQYMAILLEVYTSFSEDGSQDVFGDFTIFHFERKIVNFFGTDKLTLLSSNTKGNIIYNNTMNVEDAIKEAFSENRSIKAKIRDTAYILRKEILNVPKSTLSSKLTVQDIIQGEASVPDLVIDFFTHLLGGPDQRRGKTEKNVRKISSISQDAMYNVSCGQIKTSKHLTLGMAMKSITGSRKVIDILNRYGHCVSYSCIEELETELTYNSQEAQSMVPHGIQKMSSLVTCTAWDNYDKFIDSIDGKGTLHDTVGICFQNKDANFVSETSISTETTDNRNQLPVCRKRRSFTPILLNLEPYRKKPRMTNSEFIPEDDPRRSIIPSSCADGKLLDVIWMISHALEITDTPMWVGWNSLVVKDNLPQQQICYLPQINQSPTSLNVVLETMKRSQQIAVECGQEYMIVTYDLAIAKMAYTIQAAESPLFDNLFIMLGPFHISMAYFKAVGKYIGESGGPFILSDAGIIADGSLTGFLTGTHYNRCKRIHPLLALSLEVLHFRQFCESNSSTAIMFEDELRRMCSQTEYDNSSVSKELNEIIDAYQIYSQKTLAGEHGKTAKYWYTYVKMIRIFHLFSRSIHVGDHNLFTYCLFEMSSLFFSFNQPNYARWILRLHDNMMKIDETHPGLSEEFRNGALSIRRTPKDFSRSAVDITLEQTVNADAANRFSGISSFTNSIAARQRWSMSHYMRATIVGHVFEHLGISRAEDVTSELRQANIEKNTAHRNKIIEKIINMSNPFKNNVEQDILINISSGKAASSSTTDFLLNVYENGNKSRDKFISEVIADPSRFDKPIKRSKPSTFASDCTYKKRQKNGNIVQLKMERDMMGRLLYISLENKLDLMITLSYPLTPMPLVFCHIDETMISTQKSLLLKALESRIESHEPKWIDCTVIDGMFFLHLLGDLPATFGAVARYILVKICNVSSQEIHVVFDRIEKPSIKDIERDRRAGSLDRDQEYTISGPDIKK
ncbi:hypothetical protein SNE40_019944 [Patella caerulea]|uniref:Uncharacterized protein n=1 Tax=Patella caerulea TaxID=87958 RepID=A0AAN8GDM7_PATCE